MTDDVSSISGSESDSDEDVTDSTSDALSRTTQDSDSESYHVEGIGRRHPRVFLRNSKHDLVSIYRAVVHGKRNQPESEQELISMVTALQKQTKWVILMLAGGHFAGAVFDGSEIVCHKTFHRYVVRAKRGTVQSARDNQGNAPKSVGAFIRRHHEAALTEDIKNLLDEWSGHIKSCDRIFLRATGSARQTFFSAKAPLLDKRDTRIRMIPFPTRRPTFKELKRSWEILATVHCYGAESQLSEHVKLEGSPKKLSQNVTECLRGGSPRIGRKQKQNETLKTPTDSPRSQKKSKAVKCQESPYTVGSDTSGSDAEVELNFQDELVDLNELKPFEATKRHRKKKKKKNDEIDKQEDIVQEIKEEQPIDPYADVDVFFGMKNELYTAAKTGDSQTLDKLLSEVNDASAELQIPPDVGVNRSLNDSGIRLLHLVCKEGHKDCVTVLLNHGANPAIKDSSGGLPYVITKDKSIRNEFRKFRGEFPDKFDYTAAQIPSPVSEERENEKKAKEVERRKAARKAKNARLKDQKEEERKKKEEDKEQERFLNLSDREKRALAAEKRLLAQAQSKGSPVPTTVRCFQCAVDMTGKVPFEYCDNIFCTTKCLQAHRKQQQTRNKSSLT